MEIPDALHEALENQLAGIPQDRIIRDAETISLRYRIQSGKGERLLTSDSEAAAYAAARMPATFGAVYSALEHSLSASGCCPQTLLDAGAGTGAASWAADAQLDLKSILCLEREDAMRRMGEAMMKNGSHVLRDAKWVRHDLLKDAINEKSDLVIASYVLNEMTDTGRIEVIKKLWDSANMMLILVEPGTPVGFSNLLSARQALLESGAHIAAPCPHENNCLVPKDDWCHFTCRVSRSRLHRQLKGGEAPYEDEKFIYLALTRQECHITTARILRHPQVRSGHIMLQVCAIDGIHELTFSKKDGERYKQARKSKCGNTI